MEIGQERIYHAELEPGGDEQVCLRRPGPDRSVVGGSMLQREPIQAVFRDGAGVSLESAK